MEKYKNQIRNWKLKEILNDFELVQMKASEFIESKLNELKFPIKYNEVMNRSETFVDWDRFSNHFTFFFDFENMESDVKKKLESSSLKTYKNVILTYLQEDVVVKVPFSIFLDDWDGFFSSMFHNGMIFSEDYKLVMEVSRDYYLHSNFKINDY